MGNPEIIEMLLSVDPNGNRVDLDASGNPVDLDASGNPVGPAQTINNIQPVKNIDTYDTNSDTDSTNVKNTNNTGGAHRNPHNDCGNGNNNGNVEWCEINRCGGHTMECTLENPSDSSADSSEEGRSQIDQRDLVKDLVKTENISPLMMISDVAALRTLLKFGDVLGHCIDVNIATRCQGQREDLK
jgi:hypothetical protein